MKLIRDKKIVKIIWGILSLYLLNISIDAPNIRDINGNNTVYNEQDSIIELIIEKALDFEDAINDYDNEEPAETFKKKNFIDCFVFFYPAEQFSKNICLEDKKKIHKLKQLNPYMLLFCFYPPPEA